MKKTLFILMIAGILATSTAFGATRLLYNATATGAGGDLYVDRSSSHSVVATFTNASTTVIHLEGSHDKITWLSLGSYTIDSDDITAGAAIFNVNDRLTDYVRLNITTLTGGGAAVTATILSK